MTTVKIPYLVALKIQQSLEEIEKLFKDPKITLLVRSPQLKDGVLLMTRDNLNEVINSINNFREKENDNN